MSRHPDRLALVPIVGAVIFGVSIIALHLVRTELDPVTTALSYYGLGRYGFLLTIGDVALGLGILAFASTLGHRSQTRAFRIGGRSLKFAQVQKLAAPPWEINRIMFGWARSDIPRYPTGIPHGVFAIRGLARLIIKRECPKEKSRHVAALFLLPLEENGEGETQCCPWSALRLRCENLVSPVCP